MILTTATISMTFRILSLLISAIEIKELDNTQFVIATKSTTFTKLS